VQGSVDFYRRLGLDLRNSQEEDGVLVWAFVASAAANPNDAGARLMLAAADEPVTPSAQAVLFYCWTHDIRRLHEKLESAGMNPGPIEHPFYMRSGEFRLVDPDGYVLLVGQLDASAG
jgi:hypothetical protein